MNVFEGEQGICHSNRSGDILRNRDMACLRQFPNTVLAQHMAFCMAEAVEEMVETAVAKALSSSRAETPEAIDSVPKS